MLKSLVRNTNIKFHPKHLYFAPQWIILAVNNVCNLHCKMCDVGTKNTASNFYDHMVGTQPLNMPKELIFKIIDETALYFPSSKLGYAFTEPSVYPHLLESLSYARSKNIYTSMTTNALQLPKHASDLQTSGLNEICISLDGPPAIHNQIRGNKQSFEKALEGIEKLFSSANNKIKVSVFCAITEWNNGHMVEFIGYFKKFPLQQIGFMHTVFNTDAQAAVHNLLYGEQYFATASNTQEINFDNYNLALLWNEITQLKTISSPFPINFQPELKSKEALQNYYHHPEIKMGKKCMDVFNHLMIKSDGSVIPAHSRCYPITAGNLYSSNLKEIWNAEKMKQLRSDLARAGGLFPSCTRCCSGFAG